MEIKTAAFSYYLDFKIPEKHSASLPSSVTIPASVQIIGTEAFAGQRNLGTIIFEDSTGLKSVGRDIFKKTAWYEAQPDGLLSFDTLLYGCKGYFADETIHISAPTTIIASHAFGGIGGLTQHSVKKIIITAPIKEIPEWVFEEYPSVTELVLPAGLETLASNAFFNCESLTHCYFGGTKAEFEELSKNLNSTKKRVFRDEIMYYYSETEPSEPGNYWHYVDGEATPWFE